MAFFSIRPARLEDAGVILSLIKGLADYEKLPLTLGLDDINRDFFGAHKLIECDLAFEDQIAVGIATYFWPYATFRAAKRLFVEDLFVLPAYRGRGYGKALLQYLAEKGAAAGAARLEWQVLDWNAPSIAFYKSIGAHRHAGWDTYWLEGEAMMELAKS